jgi:hypothetical protein
MAPYFLEVQEESVQLLWKYCRYVLVTLSEIYIEPCAREYSSVLQVAANASSGCTLSGNEE